MGKVIYKTKRRKMALCNNNEINYAHHKAHQKAWLKDQVE